MAEFLIANKSLPRFVNADFIAKGLSKGEASLGDIEAGRIMLQKLHQAIRQGESISFETTLSGRIWSKLISEAFDAGFEITICYVAVETPEIATARVVKRAKEGGHFVPATDIKRRFQRSLSLFFDVYSSKVKNWYLFDNSGFSALLVAYQENGHALQIPLEDLYNKYRKLAAHGA